MRLWQPSNLNARLLVILNLVLILFLLALGLPHVWPLGWPTAGLEPTKGGELEGRLRHESSRLAFIMESHLAAGEGDLSLMAGLISHLFSHPDSYRLAAQPGEYDYDKETSVYCSLRSEDSAGVVLSTATTLSPELLRDIRLSEYLTPLAGNFLAKRPFYRRLALVTAESLVVSYPWFDFPSRIKTGRWKRDFTTADFDWYVRTSPEKNPGGARMWTCGSLEDSRERAGLICSIPVYVDRQFKGVVALEWDGQLFFSSMFPEEAFSEEPILWVDRAGQVLGASTAALSIFELPKDTAHPWALSITNSTAASALNRLLPELFKGEMGMGHIPGYFVASRPLVSYPGSLVILVPDTAWENLLFPGVPSRLAMKLILPSAGVALAAVLLLNGLWILSARRRLHASPAVLAESIAALEGLEKEKEQIRDQSGNQEDVYQRFDNSLEKVRHALTALQVGMEPEGREIGALKRPAQEIGIYHEQIKLLMDFDITGGIEAGLSKLSRQLSEYFSAVNACFLFYAPADRQFQNFQNGTAPHREGEERISIRIYDGSFFEIILNTRQPHFAELASLSREDAESTARIATQNILAGPLFVNREIFALVVLVDKKGTWELHDQEHLGALIDPLSKVISALLQIERFKKIDLLRREYCLELSRAVEMPLHRIKDEVQAIHTRLGRLTPYFKEHCEAILFEVGVLFQIAQEAREQEPERKLDRSQSSRDVTPDFQAPVG